MGNIFFYRFLPMVYFILSHGVEEQNKKEKKIKSQ